jgi:kynureninase
MRVPAGCSMRPVCTGWFSEFSALPDAPDGRGVSYGDGAGRFAGATYDPASHYRAAAVFAFHESLGLTPRLLREISLQQVATLDGAVARLDPDPGVLSLEEIPAERRAGFLALRAPNASRLVAALQQHGVWCDARGSRVRFGPAPYVTTEQLFESVERLSAVLRRG